MRVLIGCFAGLLVLLVTTASPALGCHGLAPLPDDVRVVSPATDLPAPLAGFGGAWTGAWQNSRGGEARCHTLVVEEVHANGFARVVYSVSASAALGNRLPYVWRLTGRIVAGALTFVLPTAGRGALVYRRDGADLAGAYDGVSAARLRQIAAASRSWGTASISRWTTSRRSPCCCRAAAATTAGSS